jgi:dienelactone hydrolase
MSGVVTLGCISNGAAPASDVAELGAAARYEAGSATFCVADPKRGFDPTAGVTDGQRLLLVEAWYPVEAAVAESAARRTRFRDYFADDPELLVRTERALLTTVGAPAEVIEQLTPIALEQFELERGSYRDAAVAHDGGPFPIVIYSHGTLQQRFTNDTMAESLARHGYIVLAPEHTGNDALAPLGAYCPDELAAPGVISAALSGSAAFDPRRNEYKGQTFDPFFLSSGEAPGGDGVINPAEVSLTLDRVADYRAVLGALGSAFGEVGAAADASQVGLIGYSRGAMHAVVGAELMPEVKVTVALVGGTPLRFYTRDAEAQPIHDALSAATGRKRHRLDVLTKPVVDMIAGEDSRRKATTDLAAAFGVYDSPSSDNPSPIVRDSYETARSSFRALIRIEDIDHLDLVDDPFIVATQGQSGTPRTGAFDPLKSYAARPFGERQAIRDHFVLIALDAFLRGAPVLDRFSDGRFESQGVSVETR